MSCSHICNQGRDCTCCVSVAPIGQRHLGAEPLPPSVWREHVRALAAYLLISILAALIAVAFLLGAR